MKTILWIITIPFVAYWKFCWWLTWQVHECVRTYLRESCEAWEIFRNEMKEEFHSLFK